MKWMKWNETYSFLGNYNTNFIIQNFQTYVSIKKEKSNKKQIDSNNHCLTFIHKLTNSLIFLE